jgi:hypothetical protein
MAQSPHLVRVQAWQRHLETGVLDAVLIANPHGPHFDRIVQAKDIVNAAQSFYRLTLHIDEEGKFLAASRRPWRYASRRGDDHHSRLK